MNIVIIICVFFSVLIFTASILYVFKKHRFLLLVFPFMIAVPGVFNLYKIWSFMFTNSRYSFINRILDHSGNDSLKLYITNEIVFAVFFIWFISPLNACFLLYGKYYSRKNVLYAYEECGLSFFQKYFFNYFKILNIRIFILICANFILFVSFYALLSGKQI